MVKKFINCKTSVPMIPDKNKPKKSENAENDGRIIFCYSCPFYTLNSNVLEEVSVKISQIEITNYLFTVPRPKIINQQLEYDSDIISQINGLIA